MTDPRPPRPLGLALVRATEIMGAEPYFHEFIAGVEHAVRPAGHSVLLNVLPDPLIVSTGSIRIVAKRRSGAPLNARAIRSVEPTHAR